MNEARLAQLEVAVSELTARCEEVPALRRELEQTSARLKRTETAFRRWRLGVVLTAVLGCLLLPPFMQESTAAKKPTTAQRLTRIEQALFGVSPVPLNAQDRITTASASLTNSLQAEINLRQSAVTTIHNTIDPFFAHVEEDDGVGTRTEIMFHDANIHVVSGSGETNGTVNGLGNLIVGYNEPGNPNGDIRTGSHNLIVGAGMSYSSFGCVLAGFQNNATGPYSTVCGGTQNTASGVYSSISGGTGNSVSNFYTWVGGGSANIASTNYAAVVGGASNQATGQYSAILGGNGVIVNSTYGHSP